MSKHTPGALDLSCPKKIWLQVDTDGDPDDRDEPLNQDYLSDVTWCAEPIGGIEVCYVRQDVFDSERAELLAALKRIAEFEGEPLTPVRTTAKMKAIARAAIAKAEGGQDGT